MTRYLPQAIDRLIANLAATQRGHVTRLQLLALGLTEDAIKYRLRTGRLHRVFPGVYAVGHRRTAPMDLAMAAALACGEGAVLSHRSAASLWGFVDDWKKPFEVTVARDRRPKGIRIHRSQLARRDRTKAYCIPVTSPGRTVLDCAPDIPSSRLPRFVNDARLSKWMTQNELTNAIERHPRHPGAELVREVLGGGLTRSDLEDKFVAFIERSDLPMPELNVPMLGRVVDAFYREQGVIIEVDSWRFHRDRQTFEGDRDKDAGATAEGLITVRITDERMEHAAESEAVRLERILRERGA